MRPNPSRILASLAVFATFVSVTACGDDSPGDYTEATREAFLQGCVEDDTNEDLVDVCACTYDTVTERMSFERFEQVERRLQRGDTEIPDDVADVILECIRQVSSRRS